MSHVAGLLVCAWLMAATPPPVPDVVVEGVRPAPRSDEAVARSRGVVDALTNLTRADGLIVRRFYPPCVKVIGVPDPYAEVLAGRVRAAAALVGLRPREGPCQPDVLIIFTPDVEAFVHRSALDNWSSQGDRFVAAARERLAPPPRRLATFKTFGVLPSATSGEPTRIHSPVFDFYDRTVLLLRQDVAYDFSAEALGDHLAMLALTSADETSVSPQPSIVNLLAKAGASDPPTGLTAWDRAYLRAYYKAFAEMPDSVVLGQIAHQMANEGVPER